MTKQYQLKNIPKVFQPLVLKHVQYKRSSFVLLEVLIALTLVLSCLLPLVRNPLCFFQGEIDSLINIELERDALLTLTEIKTRCFEGKISWDMLESFVQNEKKYSTETLSLQLGPLPIQRREKKVFLHIPKPNWKEGKEGGLLGLLHVKIVYSKPHRKKKEKVFHYLILTENGTKKTLSNNLTEEIPDETEENSPNAN